MVGKENNAHCVANIEDKWNTKSFYYSTTRWITYLDLYGIPNKKTSHINSCVPSDNPSEILSVATSVHNTPSPSITPTTFLSDVPSEKPMILVM